MSFPRYLVPFHLKRIQHRYTDVLIIGGGLAGLRAANAVAPELHVQVITKDVLKQSNSSYAQGGIAGVLAPDDRFERHISDTITAGGDLCDSEVVDLVVREGPERIHELIEWGTRFDEEAGELLLGREGGHSHHRVVHALGDATGREVMRAVIERTRNLPNTVIRENTFTIDLLTNADRCLGALVQDEHGRLEAVWAKQSILCTGGAGQVYRETTNPPVATGDGHALAFRAGAELRDLEFMQFHPTVLYIAGSSRSLITEAMRGEGARLVDRRGTRFMLDYDERAELAPRDVVSQAIVSQMEKTKHPCVYLDLSHLDAAYVRSRFPGIAATCNKFGIDIATDQIPVRPGAHYMIGGVTIDQQGKTTLDGLWAAGEVTSSGLHGANRLASNSLLEGLVYGMRAGMGASAAAAEMEDEFAPIEATDYEPPVCSLLDLSDIRNSLTSLMWRSAGVRRDRETLTEALESVDQWCSYVLAERFSEPVGWELQNLLTVAKLILQASLARCESRGVHFRTDFPQTDDDNWNRRLTIQRLDDGRAPRVN